MSKKNLQAIGIWVLSSLDGINDGIKCYCEIIRIHKELRNLFEKHFKPELMALEEEAL